MLKLLSKSVLGWKSFKFIMLEIHQIQKEKLGKREKTGKPRKSSKSRKSTEMDTKLLENLKKEI